MAFFAACVTEKRRNGCSVSLYPVLVHTRRECPLAIFNSSLYLPPYLFKPPWNLLIKSLFFSFFLFRILCTLETERRDQVDNTFTSFIDMHDMSVSFNVSNNVARRTRTENRYFVEVHVLRLSRPGQEDSVTYVPALLINHAILFTRHLRLPQINTTPDPV